MSKEPRYRSIGIFVIGAAVLAVTCLIFFGRFKFFDRSYPFITYFSGSVKGLQPGAPVRFRGAQVGAVKDISIVYNRSTDSLKIPVLIELYQASVKGISPDADAAASSVALIERLIGRGLRAQLGLDSIVTGQLYVQLDFMPEVPIVYNEEDDGRYQEIPTAPSPLDKIQMTLETLPLSEMVNNAAEILKKVDQFVQSPALADGLSNVGEMVKELRILAEHIDQRSDVLSDEFTALSKVSSETLKDARPAVRELQGSLEEMQALSRSIRRLADLLERQPESVILGKD